MLRVIRFSLQLQLLAAAETCMFGQVSENRIAYDDEPPA